MITEEDINAFRYQKVTAICTEDHPGYPDPLIYVVDAPVDATPEVIETIVKQERLDEIGEEFADEIENGFHVHVAWPGEVGWRDYVLDNRT